jgi:hypothetical protein
MPTVPAPPAHALPRLVTHAMSRWVTEVARHGAKPRKQRAAVQKLMSRICSAAAVLTSSPTGFGPEPAK